MNAIIPTNIKAIRVSLNDNSNVVSQFQGKTAYFEDMPCLFGAKEASTGDKVYTPLKASPTKFSGNPLGTGIHLHWELPAYFRKGRQSKTMEKLVFPHVPNRWLVVRYLSFYDSTTEKYGSITSKSWVVESDYISSSLTEGSDKITRPAVSVPLSPKTGNTTQPCMYMGRVVDSDAWDPGSESSSNYLPSYNSKDGSPLYLTAVGFVGPHFASYYPECCSVFGFWDTFSDVNVNVHTDQVISQASTAGSGTKTLRLCLEKNYNVQFRATYQVIGWIDEATNDPLTDIVTEVTDQYNEYLGRCKGVTPTSTPIDFFDQIMKHDMKWSYNHADVSEVRKSDHSIKSLTLPTQTICSGIVQEIVWNMESSPGTTYFLKVPEDDKHPDNYAVWKGISKLAVGNTVQEALAALLKLELGQTTNNDKNVLKNYEYMLEALQLGLLNDLENTPNKLIKLEEELHKSGFSSHDGGKLWEIVLSSNSGDPGEANSEVTLPIGLAEALHSLNAAQKEYDKDRSQLIIKRKQLFMDWIRYVKIYTGETTGNSVGSDSIGYFLTTKGELDDILAQGNATGIIEYTTAANGVISGIASEPSNGTAAKAVWDWYVAVQIILDVFNLEHPNTQLTLQGISAPPFYMPTEPVLVMESEKVTFPQRQGNNKKIFIRLSPEILSQLNINDFSQTVSGLSNVPVINSSIPMQTDIQALVGEAYLIIPMLASVVATALAAQGGTNNPAVTSLENFTTSLMYSQGGLSPLDLCSNPGGIKAPSGTGLFGRIRQASYQPSANLEVELSTPIDIQITFTNSSNNGWVMDAVGWDAQKANTELSANRIDPFLPLFMVWNVKLDPLLRKAIVTNSNPAYSSDNLTSFFDLDSDAVDYEYKMDGSTAVSFTATNSVNYYNSALISTNSAGVLIHQIQKYLTNHPDDPDISNLQNVVAKIGDQQFFSLALGSFNTEQTLSTYIAQVEVEDLTKGGRDTITNAIKSAATSNKNDNWYTHGFNSIEPISTGLKAQNNFGPFRSGFAEVNKIEIVDVFGQRMNLTTSTTLTDGNLACEPCYSLSPDDKDAANAGKVFLPPRLLTPTRLWFRWLSGKHFITDADFVEMNTHPDTTPVCGWIMPNHLDNSLFFYDADGKAIGSFGVDDHTGTPTLVYSTRAGNTANPQNSLSVDIGSPDKPTNIHLANFMWYVDDQDAQFLLDLMASIQNSNQFLNPANFAESVSLSVLIGSALALTRVVLGLETKGKLLPLSQADNDANSPFPIAVNADPSKKYYEYEKRMEFSTADLGKVEFPVRLGDLSNMDDGLVGYLIEGTGANPYAGATLYAPAATVSMNSSVKQPQSATIQLTLNTDPIALTLLIDPRAPVHATTGILPVSELSIPKDQYAKAMRNLAVSFVSRPVLQMKQALVVPLPKENGFSWSWITAGAPDPVSLKPNAADERPKYGYSPQTILEGWINLEAEE